MRKKIFILLAVLLFGLLLTSLYADHLPGYGITSRWKKLALHVMLSDDVPKIAVSDAVAKSDSAIFLDTRTPQEYAVSHIRNSVFTGYEEFDLSLLKGISKTRPIITYCSIGKRSDVIAEKLLQAGYTNVQNLYGGLFEWMNRGYTVVDTQNKPTEKIHAFNRTWGTWLNRGQKVY